MPKVIYEFLFGKLPLQPTYTRLQMADQSYRIPEGIAQNVPVQIKDHYIHTDFIVLDTRDEDINSPIVLGRPFLNTTRAIIYVRTREIHFQFPSEKVRCYFTNYTDYGQPKKTHNQRRRRSRRKAHQPLRDGWKDYEGEVTRYEDLIKEDNKDEEHAPMTQEDWATYEEEVKKNEGGGDEAKKDEKLKEESTEPSSTSPTKKVWRKKETLQETSSILPTLSNRSRWLVGQTTTNSFGKVQKQEPAHPRKLIGT